MKRGVSLVKLQGLNNKYDMVIIYEETPSKIVHNLHLFKSYDNIAGKVGVATMEYKGEDRASQSLNRSEVCRMLFADVKSRNINDDINEDMEQFLKELSTDW